MKKHSLLSCRTIETSSSPELLSCHSASIRICQPAKRTKRKKGSSNQRRSVDPSESASVCRNKNKPEEEERKKERKSDCVSWRASPELEVVVVCL
eukprot:3713302-Rhodomonas_salina.2